MIEITVNGTQESVTEDASLADVLASRSISIDSARGIAVAVNDKIVRRSKWDDTKVGPGTQIEIVTALQGG